MIAEVKSKVIEALEVLWRPIVDTIGIEEIDIDNNDDRRRILTEYPRFEDEQWDNLTDAVKNELGELASVNTSDYKIKISSPNICIDINYESTDDFREMTDFDTYEIDGMSSDEAIEYLNELTEISEELPFKYVSFSVFCKYLRLNKILNIQDVSDFIRAIKPGLLMTSEVVNSAIRAASIEIQQKAERQHEINQKIAAQKEATQKELDIFALEVKPILAEAGWNRKFRVSKNFDNYVLSLQLTVDTECRYESKVQSDVISKIDLLVNYAKAYLTLKIAGGQPILSGNQVRVATWSEVNIE